MKTNWFSILVILLMVSAAQARIWTDKKGRDVDADIVRVNADRTVILMTTDGRTVTVPFDAFVQKDVDYLDMRLAMPFDLHEVPWQKMNKIFGMEIWQDPVIWDDPTFEVGERMKLKKESSTDFLENHRGYPLGKKELLGEPVYSIALYGDEKGVNSLSFVFLNQGDKPVNGNFTSGEMIEQAAEHIRKVLEPVLGEAERDSIGSGDMREKVWRWDWNDHAIMLVLQEEKYTAMRIMPAERADRGGRVEKLTENEMKERMASCVERRDNGDVVITNIPMIDQGPKGYCSPATWERYLRYMDIPADMYLLALAANTGRGGGTYSHEMIAATRNLISANGRELEQISPSTAPEDIAEYIDQGLPIMWRLMSTPAFQQAANESTARRKGKEIKKSGQAEDTSAGGHICLIIGYNKDTGEIAISDSWGPRFAERWVKAYEAQRVTSPYQAMNVIKW